jgi:hypothetical protein
MQEQQQEGPEVQMLVVPDDQMDAAVKILRDNKMLKPDPGEGGGGGDAGITGTRCRRTGGGDWHCSDGDH